MHMHASCHFGAFQQAKYVALCRSETIVAHRLSSTHLPPVPTSVQPVTPPLPGTFAMNLCQRTQGCMKNENHTGFCSGHRGFKRKNAGTGEEGASSGQRRKSGGKAKGRAAAGSLLSQSPPCFCVAGVVCLPVKPPKFRCIGECIMVLAIHACLSLMAVQASGTLLHPQQ